MLHNLEYLAAISALTNKGYSYPRAELDLMWKQILLNQFHDVLPGSSIGEVSDLIFIYQKICRKKKKMSRHFTSQTLFWKFFLHENLFLGFIKKIHAGRFEGTSIINPQLIYGLKII